MTAEVLLDSLIAIDHLNGVAEGTDLLRRLRDTAVIETYRHIADMLKHMRTTVRLDDGLMADVKRFAASRGTTLTAVIEEALREKLARPAPRRRVEPARLTTVGGRGPLPGIDLDDTASLLDVLEEGHASP